MSGNQIATFTVSGRRLADYLEIGFASLIWPSLEGNEPLDETRVRALVKQGEGLAPGPGQMGDELASVEAHEARIAWLVTSHRDSWESLEMDTGLQEGNERAVLNLLDGHHRLLSTLISDRDVTVNVGLGDLAAMEPLIEAIEGEWRQRPETRLFGEGVFPAPRLGNDGYIQVRCAPGKVWVDDLTVGLSVARYGTRLWDVGNDLLTACSGHEVETRQGRTEEQHLMRFFEACHRMFGVPTEALSGYCRDLV